METDHFDRLSERRGDCSATEKVDRSVTAEVDCSATEKVDCSVTAEVAALRPKRLIAQRPPR